MYDDIPQRNERRILSKLSELHERFHAFLESPLRVAFQPRRPRMWHKHRIALQIPRRFMMLAVAQAPAVEGNEEEGMHDQSHDPVQLLALGESAVTALVSEDPDAGEDHALGGGVGEPREETQWEGGDGGDVGDGEVDEGAHVEEIADDVGHAAEGGGFEAVWWDGVVDFFHGEVWEGEWLAV